MVNLVAIYASNFCLMCRQMPKLDNSYFCSQTCTNRADSSAPMILEVPQGHSAFESGMDMVLTTTMTLKTCISC